MASHVRACLLLATAATETVLMNRMMKKRRHKKLKSHVPLRYIFAVLGLFGVAIITSLNIMLNKTAIKLAKSPLEATFFTEEKCPDIEPAPTIYAQPDGSLTWNDMEQIYYGSRYLLGLLVGLSIGKECEVGAKWVMFAAVCTCIVCTLITPWCVHTFAFSAIYYVESITEGFSIPVMYVMVSEWAPPSERGAMAAIVNAGFIVAPIFNSMAGAIATNIGWRAAFYIPGFLSIIWCVLWVCFIDVEEKNKTVSVNAVIVSLSESESDRKKQKKEEYNAVLQSSAFIAILVAEICSRIGMLTLVAWLPLYMDNVLKYNLYEDDSTVILTALAQCAFSIGLSLVLDLMYRKNIITLTTARKISGAFLTIVPALCIFLVIYAGCNRTITIAYWALAMTSSGSDSGLLANHIDIAPKFTGRLIAATHIASLLFSIAFVLIVVFCKMSANQIFITTVVIYLIGFFVYVVFASGEVQPFNVASAEGSNTGPDQIPLSGNHCERTKEPVVEDIPL